MRHTARRYVGALLATLGASALLVASPAGAAHAAPANCQYPVARCEGPTLSVSTTVPVPGEVINVLGTKFVASARITLLLRPVRTTAAATVSSGHSVTFTSARTSSDSRAITLASLRAGSDGNFTTAVTTPTSVQGVYDIVAVRGTPTGYKDPTARLDFAAGSNHLPGTNTEAGTAFTGVNLALLSLLAAALVVVGWSVNRRGKREPVRSIHG